MARVALWWRYATSWRRLGGTDISDSSGLGWIPLGSGTLGG
jgi:hypothetical protein